MQAPRLPAMFSIFRQRRPRTFDYSPRYYDPRAEERQERRVRFAARNDDEPDGPHAEFRQRMRHGWARAGGERASTMRLVMIMGVVCVILFFLIRAFGLLDLSKWPI